MKTQNKVILLIALLFIALILIYPPLQEMAYGNRVHSTNRGLIFALPRLAPTQRGNFYRIDFQQICFEIALVVILGALGNLLFSAKTKRATKDDNLKKETAKPNETNKEGEPSRSSADDQKKTEGFCCEFFKDYIIKGTITRERIFISSDIGLNPMEGYFVQGMKLDYCPFCGKKLII
jgi:hypothetical protein